MRKFELNQTYHGFTLCEVKPAESIGSTLYRFVHEKTGASLIFSDRADENKSFAISFRTTPFDDTGVFHIIEHSVFCGSEQYPVKDPFIRMMQTSMQTFLNAMTFPDKTVYPFSTRNDKDFQNLMAVYLDAVFHPAFLHNPNVFYQEGWHYEVEDGVPYVQGIVYSEMQGVFSELDGEIEAEIGHAVFSGTPYAYVYGGHPDAIPTLTYEAFCETYCRYYSPSNAVIVMDGSIDLMKTLATLDDALCHADCGFKNKISIPKKEDFSPVKLRKSYGVSEDAVGKDALVFARIVGDFDEKKKLVAINLLCSYLCDSNESPLKRALLDTGRCEDVRLYVLDDFIQPVLVLEIRGSRESDFAILKQTVVRTIQTIIDDGMDTSEFKATLSALTFAEKERSANFGLGVLSKILQSVSYGGDMAQNLFFGGTLDSLKEEIGTGYYEKLLSEVFVLEAFSEISFIADPELHEKKQTVFCENMIELQERLGKEGMDELAETADRLLFWQQSDEPEEAVAALPALTLSDVKKEADTVSVTVNEDAFTMVTIPAENPDITYLRLYFPIPKSVEGELFELSVLTNLLTNLPTKRYSAKEVQKELRKTIGAIAFDLLAVDESEKECKAYLIVALSVLNENVEAALSLIKEVMLHTRFDDRARIKELLIQLKTLMRESLASDGHRYAATRALSGFSASGAFREITGGYTAIQKMEQILDSFDDTFSLLSSRFGSMLNDIVTRDNVTVSVCGRQVKEACNVFINTLPCGNQTEYSLCVSVPKNMAEGIVIDRDVSFASLAGHLGQNADAAAYLAGHLLSYEYLWNEIRVQNGAYGAGLQVKENGELMFYSYRDPSADHSVAVYRGAALWLREIADLVSDWDAYKIGTINELEPLLTSAGRLAIAANGYFTGRGFSYLASVRKRLFDLSSEDIRLFSQMLEQITDTGSVCVVGNEETIQKIGLTTV